MPLITPKPAPVYQANPGMRVLVACEYSGLVREAFKAKAHNAWSCDFLDTEIPGQHIKGNVLSILDQHWDMMIAFPTCTALANSGNGDYAGSEDRKRALVFIRLLMGLNIERIAIENPVGAISSNIRKPDQIIQPWWFGHGETKATCLWLKGLPKLVPTDIVEGRCPRVWKEPPGVDRWKNRSRTLPGIALAMAAQWG